jgi:hypothetical protein
VKFLGLQPESNFSIKIKKLIEKLKNQKIRPLHIFCRHQSAQLKAKMSVCSYTLAKCKSECLHITKNGVVSKYCTYHVMKVSSRKKPKPGSSLPDCRPFGKLISTRFPSRLVPPPLSTVVHVTVLPLALPLFTAHPQLPLSPSAKKLRCVSPHGTYSI